MKKVLMLWIVVAAVFGLSFAAGAFDLTEIGRAHV